MSNLAENNVGMGDDHTNINMRLDVEIKTESEPSIGHHFDDSVSWSSSSGDVDYRESGNFRQHADTTIYGNASYLTGNHQTTTGVMRQVVGPCRSNPNNRSDFPPYCTAAPSSRWDFSHFYLNDCESHWNAYCESRWNTYWTSLRNAYFEFHWNSEYESRWNAYFQSQWNAYFDSGNTSGHPQHHPKNFTMADASTHNNGTVATTSGHPAPQPNMLYYKDGRLCTAYNDTNGIQRRGHAIVQPQQQIFNPSSSTDPAPRLSVQQPYNLQMCQPTHETSHVSVNPSLGTSPGYATPEYCINSENSHNEYSNGSSSGIHNEIPTATTLMEDYNRWMESAGFKQ